MITRNDLDFIWASVGADLVNVEKVDSLRLSADSKLPISEDIVREAMDRLISFDEWVEVVDEAENCE